MGFTRQGYWSGLPCPSPEDLPDPGIEPGSPALQVDSLPSELLGRLFKYHMNLLAMWQNTYLLHSFSPNIPNKSLYLVL